MKTNSSSLPSILVVATGFGILGSAVLFLVARFAQSIGNALLDSTLLAIVPIGISVLTARFIYQRSVKPLEKSLEEAVLLAKRSLPAEIAVKADASDGKNTLNFAVSALADQVRETRKREKSLVDNAADVICVIDINAKVLQVNAASKSIWGYTPEEMQGKNLSDFLMKDDIDNTLQNVLGADKSIDRIFFENRFLKKTGDIVDLLWSAHWSVSDGGLFCVVHDITERKRAEKLLKESEERIRGIFENLPAGVLVLNRAGLIEFINDTGATLTGHKADSVRGMKASDMLGFCKEPFIYKRLEDLIDEKNSGFDSQIMKENGQRFPAEISLSRLQLDGEKCYLVSFLDVSSKHAIEMAKREFVTMVSHDLRTPLTSILSILSYLDAGHGGTLTEKGAALASRAKKESERLIQLIRDLLDLEKMKAGKFSMHFSKVNAKEVVSAALEAVERYAEMHKVKLSADVPDDLVCYCDGARVIQVLINLLDNAIKFSPEGETVAVAASEQEDHLQISISNKGRLIPQEKLNTIFDRFEQVDEADSKERKGTGLGLAICRTIVEQHFGKIWVTSSKTDGTRFSFTLPSKQIDEMKSE